MSKISNDFGAFVTRRLFLSLLPLLFLFALTGCRFGSDEPARKTVKIAVNPWVGYTPFMYLDATGELKKFKFELVMVSSLGENANLITNHLVDAFAATQYEFINYRDEMNGIVPLFPVDRSHGADKIHANVGLETLRSADRTIDVYLEMGSVNDDLFRAFVKKHRLQKKRFRYHHDPQSVIQTLEAEPGRIVVVVSYEPYSSILESHGIREIASSRNLDILIVDLLFADIGRIPDSKERFTELKNAFWQAKKRLDENPEGFYRTIRKYLQGQDYAAFRKSLEGIEWLPELDEATKERLKRQGIDTGHLL